MITYPGKKQIFETYCFVHNGDYHLTTLKVFEGGIIDCWGRMEKIEFLEKVKSGFITIDVPEGTAVRIGEQEFNFHQTTTTITDGTTMVHKWINTEEFVKDVLDSYHVSLGHPSVAALCRLAYDEYILKPSPEAKEKLRHAYLDVPAHERRFLLGDQDNKDFPIRAILGI
jgi:hypothetical protein